MDPASTRAQVPMNCKETEAPRGEGIFPRTHSWLQAEPGLGSPVRSPVSQLPKLRYPPITYSLHRVHLFVPVPAFSFLYCRLAATSARS